MSVETLLPALAALLPPERLLLQPGQLAAYESDGLPTFRVRPAEGVRRARVAYHDACHLAHAQGITEAPRWMLASIPNLTLLEVPEGELCCGSAGTYNLEQPALATTLGERKARNILQTGGEAVAMGNIGCMVQIQTHLAASGHSVPVLHTMEVLDMAYGQ